MSTGNDWDGARYDQLSGPQAAWGTAVMARMDLKGDETVLDAGCGSGRVTQELLGRLPRGHVVALDASPSMLEQARQRLAFAGPRVSFVHADLAELSPSDLAGHCPVDAVLSTATFHWVTDHDRLFANLYAVMRPGAQLVAQCGGEGNIEDVQRAVRSLGTERAGTWLYASAEATEARLSRAGFTQVRAWCQPELVRFGKRADLVDFLQTVCLREHLGTLAPQQRRAFAQKVAEVMAEPVIDYVRLNIVARRP